MEPSDATGFLSYDLRSSLDPCVGLALASGSKESSVGRRSLVACLLRRRFRLRRPAAEDGISTSWFSRIFTGSPSFAAATILKVTECSPSASWTLPSGMFPARFAGEPTSLPSTMAYRFPLSCWAVKVRVTSKQSALAPEEA
jgi:hypothetical protein